MTDKELKRLSRKDLLELMLMQSKKIDNLQAELEEANRRLENKEIVIQNAGSIAEASLRINRVLESTQAAADMYLNNITLMKDKTELSCREEVRKTKQQCQQYEETTRQQIQTLLENVKTGLQKKAAEHPELESIILDVITGVAE